MQKSLISDFNLTFNEIPNTSSFKLTRYPQQYIDSYLENVQPWESFKKNHQQIKKNRVSKIREFTKSKTEQQQQHGKYNNILDNQLQRIRNSNFKKVIVIENSKTNTWNLYKKPNNITIKLDDILVIPSEWPKINQKKQNHIFQNKNTILLDNPKDSILLKLQKLSKRYRKNQILKQKRKLSSSEKFTYELPPNLRCLLDKQLRHKKSRLQPKGIGISGKNCKLVNRDRRFTKSVI